MGHLFETRVAESSCVMPMIALAWQLARLYPRVPGTPQPVLPPPAALRILMAKGLYDTWLSVGLDAWHLGVEASVVIALRTAKVGLGRDPRGHETSLMFTEKFWSAFELQSAFLTGKLGTNPASVAREVLNQYTTKVRANRRRLS